MVNRRAGLGLVVAAFVVAMAAWPTPSAAQAGMPRIDSVTPVQPRANQTITIRGAGFGSKAAYNGNSRHIIVRNLTRNWDAGCRDRGSEGCVYDSVTLSIGLWADNQITINGFTGEYGNGTWSLNAGDVVRFYVWNAQTDRGPATYTVTVGGGGGQPSLPWSVTLTASTTSPQPGQSFTLTARANQSVGPTPFFLQIFYVSGNFQVLVDECGDGTVCESSQRLSAGQRVTYGARVSHGDGGNVQAQSAFVTVTAAQSQPVTCYNAAEFVTQSPYLTVNSGASFSIFFELRNTGTCTWRSGDGHHLASTDMPMGASLRQSLTHEVPPGSTYRWTIQGLTAPSTPGVYRTWWTARQGGASFGPGLFIEVTVVDPCRAPSGIPLCDLAVGDILLEDDDRNLWGNGFAPYRGGPGDNVPGGRSAEEFLFEFGRIFAGSSSWTHAGMVAGRDESGRTLVVHARGYYGGPGDIVVEPIENTSWFPRNAVSWAIIRPRVDGNTRLLAARWARDIANQDSDPLIVFDIWATRESNDG